MEFKKGELITVTGANGAGKSTLAKLIACCERPNSGDILYDGHPVQELRRNSLRRRIAILLQDALLVHGTIRDNITLGIKCPEEVLREAVYICGLENILKRQPQGIDTFLESGMGLSGGERQRVVLARMFVRRPSIVILDEVTNHLDEQGVELVVKLIPKFKSFCSVLAITHDERIKALSDKSIFLEVT